MTRRIDMVVAAFAATAWSVIEFVAGGRSGAGDLVVYRHAARLLSSGFIPYRDFDIEYPPLATGLFWAVDRIPGSDRAAWSVAMLACLIVVGLSAVAAARALSYRPAHQLGAGILATTLPLLLGDLGATRYDLAVAAVMGAAIVAALRQRMGWAWALLAIATGLKLTPVVIAPLLLVWHLRHRDPRRGFAGAAAYTLAVALTLVPFAVIAPGGTWRLFSYHLDRPAQVESLVASLVHLTGQSYHVQFSFGSDNVAGPAADRLALLATAMALVVVIAIAVTFARAPRPSGRLLVLAITASLAATIAFGKVASPQYLIWLVPAVALVPARRGWTAGAVAVAAFGLTSIVYPALYRDLVDRAADLPVTLVALRNGLLLFLIVVCWPVQTAGPNGDVTARLPALPPGGPGLQSSEATPRRID